MNKIKTLFIWKLLNNPHSSPFRFFLFPSITVHKMKWFSIYCTSLNNEYSINPLFLNVGLFPQREWVTPLSFCSGNPTGIWQQTFQDPKRTFLVSWSHLRGIPETNRISPPTDCHSRTKPRNHHWRTKAELCKRNCECAGTILPTLPNYVIRSIISFWWMLCYFVGWKFRVSEMNWNLPLLL